MRLPQKISAIVATVLFGAAGLAYGSGTGSDNGSVSYGIAAGQANQEQFATAVGFFALPSTGDMGNGNTALGYTTMYFNQTGSYNTAVGVEALNGNTTGYGNTGIGTDSLVHNENGSFNTASGTNALSCFVTGSANTASGAFALSGGARKEGAFESTCPAVMGSGSHNTADGYQALNRNTTGTDNAATGYQALSSNLNGYQNTASGAGALFSSTAGNDNTASGFDALYSNTNGNSNTADGNHTLYRNTSGYHDTATGAESLFSNTSGNINTAIGYEALFSNTTGSNNIAVGMNAGYNLTHGSNNIDIGNEGVAGESGLIRIGTAGTQTAIYVAGIENTKVAGSAVYVTSKGELGVLASSQRYKTAIAPMGAGTEKLQELRPVSFHLKTDPNGPVQYGLIAEEVAKVYPELVIRDEAGKIQGVRYEELAPMLLNEMQQQKRVNAAQADQNNAQAAKIASLEQQLAGIQATLVKLHPSDVLVARR